MLKTVFVQKGFSDNIRLVFYAFNLVVSLLLYSVYRGIVLCEHSTLYIEGDNSMKTVQCT